MEPQLLLDIFALPDDAAWPTRAACGDTDPEVFADDADGLRAYLICRRCPVQTECLQHALDNDERFGIWGGLNRGERERLRPRGRKSSERSVSPAP